jgi:hypothetical protein
VDDYNKLKTIREKIDLDKDKKYKEESKERLKKICSTKIKTTMIGALDSIEKKFKEFYSKDGKPTNEQLTLQRIFDELRTEILDKGNQQIRNLDTEFEQYVVEWKRYTLKLPVTPFNTTGTN